MLRMVVVVNDGQEHKDIFIIDRMKRARLLKWGDVDLTCRMDLDGRVNSVICLNADSEGRPIGLSTNSTGWLKHALRNHSTIHMIHPNNHGSKALSTYV